jgi:hypothetical protein
MDIVLVIYIITAITVVSIIAIIVTVARIHNLNTEDETDDVITPPFILDELPFSSVPPPTVFPPPIPVVIPPPPVIPPSPVIPPLPPPVVIPTGGNQSFKFPPGRYNLTETYVINSTSGSNVTIEALDTLDPPIFSSDVNLSGWVDVTLEFPNISGSTVWCADIPSELIGKNINTMYIGDTKIPQSFKLFEAGTHLNDGVLVFAKELRQHLSSPDEIMDAIVGEIDDIGDMLLGVYPRQRWIHAIMKIGRITAGDWDETIQSGKDQSTGLFATHDISGRNLIVPDRFLESGLTTAPYRTENITLWNTTAFMTPGTWKVNTRLGKIYYRRDGLSAPVNVNTPLLTEYFLVDGADNVHIKDLHIIKCGCEYQTPEDNVIHSEFAVYDKADAALRIRESTNCTVDNVHIYNTGSVGIRVDLGSQNNIINNCEIYDIGGNGISIIGYPPGSTNTNHDNQITNNLIHNVGLIHRMGQGVVVCQTHHIDIQNNEIHNIPFNGVSVVGLRFWVEVKLTNYSDLSYDYTPEYRPIILDELSVEHKDNIENEEILRNGEYLAYIHTDYIDISYNEMYNIATDIGDSNTIYVHTSKNNINVHHNYIHDIDNIQGSTVLRTDNVQNEGTFSNNILYIISAEGGINISNATTVVNNYIVNPTDPDVHSLKIHTGGLNCMSTMNKNIMYSGVPQTHLTAGVSLNHMHLLAEYQKIHDVDVNDNLYDITGLTGVVTTDDFETYINTLSTTNTKTLEAPWDQETGESDIDYIARVSARVELNAGTVAFWQANFGKNTWVESDRSLFNKVNGDQFGPAFVGTITDFILSSQALSMGIAQLDVTQMGRNIS